MENTDVFLNSFTHIKDERPTLPSLRSLNLPIPRNSCISRERAGAVATNTLPSSNPNEFFYANHYDSCKGKIRFVSNSSTSSLSSSPSNYSNSRATSLSPFKASPSPNSPSSSSTHSNQSTGSFRLVPCEMENADAIVLVTEPTEASPNGKAMLLVGPAAQPYRQPNTRPITKGARAHPYKIAPSQSLSRRLSMLSIRSQLSP